MNNVHGRLWWYVIGFVIGFMGAAMLISLAPVPVAALITALLLLAGSVLGGVLAWAQDEPEKNP
jgi:hypothetical protein